MKRCAENRGPGASKWAMFSWVKSSGRVRPLHVLVVLDGDDTLHPDALLEIARAYVSAPGVLVTYGSMEGEFAGKHCRFAPRSPHHVLCVQKSSVVFRTLLPFGRHRTSHSRTRAPLLPLCWAVWRPKTSRTRVRHSLSQKPTNYAQKAPTLQVSLAGNE